MAAVTVADVRSNLGAGMPMIEADNRIVLDKHGSYIINPAATRLLCVYGGDGATRGKTCRPPGASEHCIPACIPQYDGDNSRNSYDRWCDTTDPADHVCSFRPWRPERIGEMLERDRLATKRGEVREHGMTYNEVIIDGFFMNAQLPGSVEAGGQ